MAANFIEEAPTIERKGGHFLISDKDGQRAYWEPHILRAFAENAIRQCNAFDRSVQRPIRLKSSG